MLDLKCGYEADMSGIGFGKNNWHLFAEDIEIQSQFAEQMGAGQGTTISDTAKVNTFSYNTSSTCLNLDVTLNLDKTIRIVFNGSTPNDGLAWMMD